MVFYSWDQNFFTLLNEIILDRTNALYTGDVLIESRVNRHMLCPYSESLSVLVLVLDIEDEGDACWILGQHLFEELDCEMDTFNNK